MTRGATKRPPKRNPLDEVIVEELTKDGWKPFHPYGLHEERDGQYTLTVRVRTKRGPKRVPDKTIAKLADELYEAHMMEPYDIEKGTPYERLMTACRTRRG